MSATAEHLALLQSLARQAAAWWRRQLADPGYLGKFQNGDTSRAGELTQVMASMAALKSPGPSTESIDRFEQLLTEALWNRMQQKPCPVYEPSANELALCTPEQLTASRARPARYVVLSVDYGPEGLLRETAEQARVSGFPWKTTMWVNWDADAAKCYLDVRHGYGAPVQRLEVAATAPADL